MIYVFLAEGFEETEAIAPIDMLRRAKCDVVTVGLTNDSAKSSHGILVLFFCRLAAQCLYLGTHKNRWQAQLTKHFKKND